MNCNLCKKNIKKKDDYCRLTDFKEGKFYMDGFYHIDCYNKKIRGEFADNVINKVMKRFGNINKALLQLKNGR